MLAQRSRCRAKVSGWNRVIEHHATAVETGGGKLALLQADAADEASLQRLCGARAAMKSMWPHLCSRL